MKSVRLFVALSMIAVLGTARASEPSSEESRWNEALVTVVKVVAGTSEPQELAAIATPSAFIAPFDLNRTESVTLLRDRLPTRNVVSARAYIHPSVSSASDIVADLTSTGTIDPETIRRLTPEDPALLRKADATMARWFATALEAKAGDPVAVMVLYDDGKGEPQRKPGLTFLLVRGTFDNAGQPHISLILYGTMDAAVK